MEFAAKLTIVPVSSSNGCAQPADWPYGGFLRSIRPLVVARLFSAVLGVAFCLPAGAHAEEAAAARKPAPSHRTASGTTRKPAYSARASRTRKVTLARARAAARAREAARLS